VDLTCTISDDGIGFNPDIKYSGYGMRSMEERANTMGAHLRFTTGQGEGTSVVLTVPLVDSTATN
jgi:signal transduction histidine kinase